MSPLAALRSLTLVAALAACHAGQSEQRESTNAPATPVAGADTSAVATSPASTQAIVAEAGKGRSCNTDADCAIKDVGSCCGYQPQCLNKDTPTFPEKVKAQCAREGRVSTCGMLAISGCRCQSGKCENQLLSDESMSAPAAPAPLK